MSESRQPSKPEMSAARPSSAIIPPLASPAEPTSPAVPELPPSEHRHHREESPEYRHRRDEDPEDPSLPRREKPSIWSIFEGAGAFLAAAFALGGLLVAVGVAKAHFDALETWQAAHIAETKERIDKRDAAYAALRDQVGRLELDGDHRMTKLEGSFATISASLVDLQATTHDLDRKLDDLSSKRLR